MPWIDIQSVSNGRSVWVDFAALPPSPLEGSTERWIAYGLVVDTDFDGVADLRYGMDIMPAPSARGVSRFNPHVWRTDLHSGRTESAYQPGPVWLCDCVYPGGLPDGARAHIYPLGGFPVRFYARASMVEDGRVVATDYAPDAGWLGSSP